MKKLLIASVALLTVAVLAVAGVAVLGPDGAEAQEQSNSDEPNAFRFSPLDEVLDELVAEDVINGDQADAIRERMSDWMRALGDGFHFRMKGFAEDVPDGLTPPPGPPGTDEFDAWLDEMQELLGDDFFGGHMFRFDGRLPEDGSFPFGGHMFQFDGDLPEDGFFPFGGRGHRGPGMMGDGFHGFGGFGDIDDLEGFIDEMTERFGTELPEHMQDMIDHLTDELSEVDGASTSLDA